MRIAPFVAGLSAGFLQACGSAEDPCTLVWYADADGDGHGDPAVSVKACTAPAAHTETSDDCDDANADVHPGADEICNELDDDCDEGIDFAASDAPTWYADRDADGFGDDAQTLVQCSTPSGYVAVGGDCDEASTDVHPGADESCNDVDDDCDDLVDAVDPDLLDGTLWYADVDHDYYGDPATEIVACTHPADLVGNGTDCDDGDAAIHPTADEVCDEIDNDCDSLVDDEDDDGLLYGTTTFYADADGDGYGDGAATTDACTLPAGFADNRDDCDDTDAAVGPPLDYYSDSDGDGYGDGGAHTTCEPGDNEVLVAGDCGPRRDVVHPGATEVCNDYDDNCDGLVDIDDPLLSATLYGDADGDGYGSDTDTITACDRTPGYVRVGGDCDDGTETVNPGALEWCDGVDNDCTGAIDESVVYADWYADDDGDGYGDESDVVNDCAQPSGYLPVGGDCDDSEGGINPEAIDVCGNALDDDCNGVVDNCRVLAEDADAVIIGDDPVSSVGTTIGVGDVDADGTTDLLVFDDYDGRGLLVLGPVSGEVDVADAIAITGSDEEFAAVATADLDGDGFGDVVAFGEQLESLGGGVDGIVTYGLLGPVTADVLSADADTRWVAAYGTGQSDNTATLLSDFDGDGAPDLALGMPSGVAAALGGAVWVTPSAASGTVDLDSDAPYLYSGGGSFGSYIFAIDDADGDGIEDMAIDTDAGVSGPGAIYVVLGGDAPGWYDVELVAAATITAPTSTDFQNRAMAAGDYDQDGSVDLFQAADGDDPLAGDWVYGLLGPFSGSTSVAEADVRWESAEYADQLGWDRGLAVADADGDKFPDVVIGSDLAGAVYLQLGPASGVVDVLSLLSFESTGGDIRFGASVAVVPDWSGDDKAEIAVGATRVDDVGAVYVFFSDGLY